MQNEANKKVGFQVPPGEAHTIFNQMVGIVLSSGMCARDDIRDKVLDVANRINNDYFLKLQHTFKFEG